MLVADLVPRQDNESEKTWNKSDVSKLGPPSLRALSALSLAWRINPPVLPFRYRFSTSNSANRLCISSYTAQPPLPILDSPQASRAGMSRPALPALPGQQMAILLEGYSTLFLAAHPCGAALLVIVLQAIQYKQSQDDCEF